MNQALIDAIVERIQLGHTEDAIRQELRETGYQENDIDAAYQTARTQAVEGGGAEPGSSGDSAARAVQLPSFGSLLSDSISFVFTRGDLLLAALVVGSILGLAEHPVLANSVWALLVGLVILVVSVVNAAAVAYVCANTTSNETYSYTDGLRWASSHIGSFLWVGILTFLVVVTGFVFFIIPGIILGTYLAFTYLIVASTETRGLAALCLSHQAVRGHWWGVWLRYIGIALIIGIAFAVLSGLVGVLFGQSGLGTEAVSAPFWINLIGSILGAMIGIVLVRALALMYHALAPKIQPPEPALESAPRTMYLILAWAGLVAVPFAFFLVTVVLVTGFMMLAGLL